jgi:hypothetical protein
MPTVLRTSGYRFFFYSLENNEPAHIHVERDGRVAKYWLRPAVLAMNSGFRAHELTKLHNLVRRHGTQLETAWDVHFNRKI